jgi:hypothetical protein
MQLSGGLMARLQIKPESVAESCEQSCPSQSHRHLTVPVPSPGLKPHRSSAQFTDSTARDGIVIGRGGSLRIKDMFFSSPIPCL